MKLSLSGPILEHINKDDSLKEHGLPSNTLKLEIIKYNATTE